MRNQPWRFGLGLDICTDGRSSLRVSVHHASIGRVRQVAYAATSICLSLTGARRGGRLSPVQLVGLMLFWTDHAQVKSHRPGDLKLAQSLGKMAQLLGVVPVATRQLLFNIFED